jgi:hypothetical protein
MEINFLVEDFNNLIKTIEYSKSIICYATNTVMIDFKDKNNEQIYSFWIHPAWRIVLENRIIINSYNYPYHENYTEEEQEKENRDFYEWCSKTDFMKYEKIKNIQVLDSCDLLIEWENGAILNKFINDIEDANYIFYDHLKNKIYYFYYGKIKQVDWERENRKK